MYAGVTKTIPRYMLHVIVFAVDSRDTTRISIPYQCSRTSRIQIYQNPFFVEFGLPGKFSDEKGRDRPKIKRSIHDSGFKELVKRPQTPEI